MRVFRGTGKVKKCSELAALHVFDQGQLFVAGKAGRVVRTLDGGKTWSDIQSVFSSPIYDLYGPLGDLHAVGLHGAAVSQDAGDTWKVSKKAKRRYVVRIEGTSADRRFALLEGGAVWAGTTKRSRWTEHKVADRYGSMTLRGLWVDDAQIFVAGNGCVLRSLDDGVSFAPVWQKPQVHLYGVWGAERAVVAVGQHQSAAVLLRSVDGGASFSVQALPSLPAGPSSLFDVWAGDASDWWAVGKPGIVLHSADGANTWQRVDLNTTDELRRVRGLPGGEAWILGRKKLYVSKVP